MVGEGIVFREARLSDIPKLHDVRMSVTENVLLTPSLVTLRDYEEYLTKRGKGWVCEVNNSIAGFAIVDLTGNNVWALFLHPMYERRGIGRQLHSDMLDWYFAHTDLVIWLSTSPGTRAESFYRNAGWRQIGILSNGELRFEMTAEDWVSSRGKHES